MGERPRGEVFSYSAQPGDYGAVNEINRTWGGVLHQDVTAERQLFPGAAPIVLAVAALVPPVMPVAAAAGGGLIVAFDASLGLHGATFAWLYDLAPPFRAFRVPARFGAVVAVFLSLLAGLGFHRLWAPRRSPWMRAAAVGIAAFGVIELRPDLTLTAISPTPPPVYAALAADPGAVIVDLPLPDDDSQFWIDPTYLYYSTFHWHPLLNGYSGFLPSWYPRLVVASREMPDANALDEFRHAGARYLVLHEEFYAQSRYAEIAAWLDRQPGVTLVARGGGEHGATRLYRLGTAPAAGVPGRSSNPAGR